jgi:hypothetical protein
MGTRRWQDWVNALVGLWLFASPWVMGYAADSPSAAWNAYLLGAAIVIFAAVAVSMPKAWEEWINMILAAWLVISPWALGFASAGRVGLNAVVCGLVVGALATWAMMADRDFERWWHDHHTAS